MKIVLATTNTHKADEMRAILAPLLPGDVSLECLADLPLDISPAQETGATFADNALLKARHYALATACLCIADDSGLCVDALGGVPGIYSSRWAGVHATDADRIEKLLTALKASGAIASNERQGRFVCVAAAASPAGWWAMAEGSCHGVIGQEPSGANGFGYDPVFFLPELGRTFAELTQEEKNRFSHRSLALTALAPMLAPYLLSASGAVPATKLP